MGFFFYVKLSLLKCRWLILFKRDALLLCVCTRARFILEVCAVAGLRNQMCFFLIQPAALLEAKRGAPIWGQTPQGILRSGEPLAEGNP